MSIDSRYQRIINPETDRWVKTNGKLGKLVIRKYLRQYQYQIQLGGGESEQPDNIRDQIQTHLQQYSDYQSKELKQVRQLEDEAHQLELQSHQKLGKARRRIGELIIKDRKTFTDKDDDPMCVLTKQQGTCEPNTNLSSDDYYHDTGKEYCIYNATNKLCEFGKDGLNHNQAQETRSELLSEYDSDPHFTEEDSIFWREDDDGHLEPLYSYHNPTQLQHLVHGKIHEVSDSDQDDSAGDN
jgi:hypothetical protein